MTTSIIINADDFGLSPGVNRGIVEGFREGVLSSTTMLVNLGGFADAVRLARANPDLPVGIHLSLLWGPPISPPGDVPTLVEGNGEFPSSLSTLARRYFLGRLGLDEVRRELSAQIRVFREAGLTPTHVDTHKHVHCLPGVLRALVAAAAEHGIERVRVPLELPLRGADRRGRGAAPRVSAASVLKSRLIRLLCRDARRTVATAGMRTTDHFCGIAHQACLNSDVILHILSHLREGVTELMCHPGYTDDEAARYSATPPHRETELAGLKDARIRQPIHAGAVRLTDYGSL